MSGGMARTIVKSLTGAEPYFHNQDKDWEYNTKHGRLRISVRGIRPGKFMRHRTLNEGEMRRADVVVPYTMDLEHWKKTGLSKIPNFHDIMKELQAQDKLLRPWDPEMGMPEDAKREILRRMREHYGKP